MSSGPSTKQVYRVTIFNQNLSIASSTSASEFQRIADQVDLLMTKIASKTGIVDGTRVGVLAAMHLADHLHQNEQKLASAQDELEAVRAECNSVSAQLGAARLTCANAAQELEAAKAQLTASESARAALEEELRQARKALEAAQNELATQRSRIGKDAGRLHTLLAQALDAASDDPSQAQDSRTPSLFSIERPR